jgi:hypothetical protein
VYILTAQAFVTPPKTVEETWNIEATREKRMLSPRFAAAIALLWSGVALASLDLTDLLFRPNLLADKSLMEHAKTVHTPPMIQTQGKFICCFVSSTVY